MAPSQSGPARTGEPTSGVISSIGSESAISSPIRSDPFAPGEVIAEKYVVERVIGVGGVAIVVAARHMELDETVAIKVLQPEVQQRKELVQRFAREAKAAVRIKSEYAARIFDVGVAAGRGPYLVMEYLEGQDLGVRLATTGPLPMKRAVEFVMQACEALAVAHANGIVHRDIKPENLFLARRADGTEIIKVLDFGISKAALTGSMFGSPDEALLTQELMGTPLYMSPEQIRSTSTVDRRADIWSLGVVLYELLTGHLAFSGDAITKICADVLEREPPPISKFVPEVPEELQAVIDRCLAKDPERRYQNVAELAIALLPFGPSMGRIFAERSSTILHAAGQGEGVVMKFSSAPPPTSTSSASVRTLTGNPQALQVPRVPAITAPSAASASAALKATASIAAPGPPGSRRIVTLGVTAVALLVALACVVTYSVVATSHPVTAAAAATPAAPTARPVTVMTEPPGARVEWDGKLLGETPITTPLPFGTQRLKLSRDGYGTETLTITVSASDAPDRRAQLTLSKLESANTPPPAAAKPEKPEAPLGGGIMRAGTLGPRPGTALGARPMAPIPGPKAAPPSPVVVAPAPAAPPAATPDAAAAAAPTKDAVKVKVIGEKKTNVVVVE